MRMAERFASDNSQGYPDQYGRYLEHFLGGRPWNEGWGTEGWEEARVPDTFSGRAGSAQVRRSGLGVA
jgi:hypothetical protein